MKNYFTKEQIEKLKSFEHHFYTAVYENYKRASAASDNDYVADLFEKTTGGKLNRNWSCGTCVLNAYKAVGKLYYESKEYWLTTEEDVTEKNLSKSAKHSEAQEPVSGTEGTEGVGVNDTKSKVLEAVQTETEPVAPKATRGKKVANKGKKGSKK